MSLKTLTELNVGLVHQRYVLGVDPHARVFNRHPKSYVVIPPTQHLDADQHVPGVGKLDGVGCHVEQNLPQPYRIPFQGPGQVLVNSQFQRQTLFPSPCAKHVHQIIQGVAKVKGNVIQHQLAGFHTGDVQQVIDNGRQPLRSVEQGVDIFPLVLIEGGI